MGDKWPTLERESALSFAELHEKSLDLGHDLEPGWHDTEPASWIAQCMACLAWVGLDFVEGVYGKALEPCPGAPPQRPAPYRSQMDEAAPYQGQTLETRPFLSVDCYIRSWNWDDQHLQTQTATRLPR
jgi:hypothetical protein